ncbi:adenylyl-sulfate kinase [Lapillicoccus sp.]|uniref:adenylyl-sulfate kinase n=1 Tax=Lapillicoccus sp. TaxID=1909287 RepID=UPI0025CE8FE7|nr:adenylyl-sulfate kinase [Lapillicoccus sp.]
MTAPDAQTSAGTPHVAVDGAVLADLELVLGGVQLPWSHLGGGAASPVCDLADAGDNPDDRFSLDLRGAPGLASHLPGLDGAALVLTDPTSLPVARLQAVRLIPAREGLDVDAVSGTLTTLRPTTMRPTTSRPTTPRPPGDPTLPAWSRPAAVVVVVQRPLLRDELEDLLTAVGPGGELRVLVPTGPTPDGIPGLVLLDAVRSVAAARGAVEVDPVPVFWRGPAEDTALVEALADRVGSPAVVLGAEDPRWLAVRADVLDGRPALDVAAAAEPALTAWRPPVDRRGVVVFFTGFSGSGKSSIADALVEHVRTRTRRTITLLDGDVVRTMLSSGLGFDRAGRDLNIRRIGYVAAEIARHHGMAVCAPIAPFAETRAAVRRMVEQVGDFVLVHVSTPIEECERRDRKGLYARARSGEIADFTGISSPYEAPTDADLVVDTTGRTLEESLDEVLDLLRTTGWITA